MQVKMFSAEGDTVLLDYDPATADMAEVNKQVDDLEKQVSGRAFNLETGEPVETVTPTTEDVTIVRQLQGG
jgi:hypothetical protein